MKTLKFILGTLFLLLLIAIFQFSAQPATESDELSTSVTEKIVNRIAGVRDYPEEDKEEIVRSWNNIVRKYAHFSLYCLLGMILSGFLLCYNLSMRKRWLIALSFCLLYAVSDEIHQLFVPGRGCELRDVLIDGSGSFLGTLEVLGISAIILKIRGRRRYTAY